jgi:hypothetical protein
MPTGQIFQHPVVDDASADKRKKGRGKACRDSSNSSSSTQRSMHIGDSSDEEDDEETLFNDIEDLTADDDDSLFRIYWQNRLVPETKLNKLSFFPEAKTLLQCDKLGIAHQWKSRIKCFLFFDANFHNISNNKLNLRLDPDLQTWITSAPVVRQSISLPKNVKDQFPK